MPYRRLMSWRSALLVGAFTGSLALVNLALGCNIPVFRYAFDHWQSDPYRLTIYHAGSLEDGVVKELAREAQSEARGGPPLWIVDTIEGQPEAPADPAAGRATSPPLPMAVIRYPASSQIDRPIWTGPLEALSIARLRESPARAELVWRLAAGESAVWIFLISGQDARDRAAETTLRQEISRLEKELKLPPRTSAPEDAIPDEDARPLKIAFSVLPVNRQDPQEEFFVRMLLHTEGDLAGLNEPMAFLVFGRGRVLPGLVGRGINAENIQEAAEYVVGPCACQLKRDNPGVDLLLAGSWGFPARVRPLAVGDPLVQPGSRVPIPPGLRGETSSASPPVLSSTPLASPPRAEDGARRILLIGVGLAALVMVGSLITILRERFRFREQSRSP